MPAQIMTASGETIAGGVSRRPVAVRVDNVSKFYSSRRRWFSKSQPSDTKYALQNVSFDVKEGEMTGLLGPNGAGKTSLLKSIATLLQVNSGQILVHGHDVEAEPVAARRLIGLVTCDERSFYWRLTGRQNLKFFASLYGIPDKKAAERIVLLLEMLGLSDAIDTPYHSYSTGMRQKLAIGRGLLAEPRLVLYDEPTRSLDPLSAQHIREWILASRAISPTTTHLIATNQLREAEQLCDRVLILNHGTLIADGGIDQIRRMVHSEGRAIHKLTCSGLPRDFQIAAMPQAGLFDVSREPNAETLLLRVTTTETGEGLSLVFAEILRQGGCVIRCDTGEVPFEEVFCSLVQGQTAGGNTR
jgi:ABC-2 type transport system ATP-binding protein